MEKKNYFNSIPWREARLQLGHCRFMAKEEFADGTKALQGKKIVIVGWPGSDNDAHSVDPGLQYRRGSAAQSLSVGRNGYPKL